uniref:Tubulin--tyrosine ligase-like protein 5 n=1 Tax=Globisporangium ultimum (strain ATCC 200006 / CBS 805.95 / DAOM BR144) TaxID=431595 RepID=K3XAF0_GLOUD
MRSLLLLAAGAIAVLADVPRKIHAQHAPQHTAAHYFLPEEPRHQHQVLLDQLELLGIKRFVPPKSQDANEANQDPFFLWSFLPKTSTEVDLVWSISSSPPYDQLSFSKTYRPKLNHLPGAEALTSSDMLYKHIKRNKKKLGQFYFNFFPDHYVLPRDEVKMAKAFPAILKKVEFEMKRERDWYIYQRFLVRELPINGDESAFTPGSVIINENDLKAKLENEFKGKQVEVASYVEPYLLDGHKFKVGFYVAVTSIDPLRVYVFNHASIKIAKILYPDDVKVTTDNRAYTYDEYLPPWDFPELQNDFHEFPSSEREGSNAWQIVKRYMMMHGLDTYRLQSEINDAIIRTVVSNRGHFQQEIGKLKRSHTAEDEEDELTDLSDNFFDLWKFDFEIEDTGKPWLIKVHSNPSLTPEKSIFGTDEAIKKRMVFDLLNLIGVHPQAKLPFDKFFRPSDSAFCAKQCADKTRTWDTACWSCPGWFPPYVARRLFDSMNEYARRGRFNLLFPDLEKDHSKFMDMSLSEHDIAFDRYLKSLSSGYAETHDDPLSDRKVTCVYREHCSNNGDCVNGVCKCDETYEGTTCYIPKDMEREKALLAQAAAAEKARAGETWKERVGHLWNRSPEPATARAANANAAAVPHPSTEMEMFSASKLLFALLVLAGFLFGGYRVFLMLNTPGMHDRKSN